VLKVDKQVPSDLALFGGAPIFSEIRSTSNLAKPDIEIFLKYLKSSFDLGLQTNNGPLNQELESRLAELHEVDHCVTFCNGFWGLVLTIKELALPNKSQVVMPTMTYRRLADVVVWSGLTPNFCDIDPGVLGVSVETVESRISSDTALILVAQPIIKVCDMNGLVDLAETHKIPIVFDSVEASYASIKGRMVGSFGDAECFSMHASKLINGFEGGYMTTNNAELASIVKLTRAFGMHGQDNVTRLGVNAKLNEVHAAMALAGLDDLPNQIQRNLRRYKQYKEGLQAIRGLEIVEYDSGEKRSFKNVLVKLNSEWPMSRENTIHLLHAENMLVRPYYFPPLHTKDTDYDSIISDLPNAELVSEQYLLLPSGEFLSERDIERILTLLLFLQENGIEFPKNEQMI